MRTLFSLACVLTVAVLSACSAFDAFDPNSSVGRGAAGDAGVLSSPGCSPAGIQEQGDVTCATCDFAAESICSDQKKALCEVRENSFGEACQLCVTADKTILYDDCFTGTEGPSAAVRCEETVSPNDAVFCEVCFDDSGTSVSKTCGPRSEECTDVVNADGRGCTRCSANGEVVSTACDATTIDPSQCAAYGNDFGSCVDCFGVDGALLSHFCTPPSDPQLETCSTTLQPDGLECTLCVDQYGTTISNSCEENAPRPLFCSLLTYSEQTCTVCVDDRNALISSECQDNDCTSEPSLRPALCRDDADCSNAQVCFDGTCVDQNNGVDPSPDEGDQPADLLGPPPCDAPPPCSTAVDGNGTLCRTCPITNADGSGGNETLCAHPVLSCALVSNDVGADNNSAPAPQGESCMVCSEPQSGLEVYRDCSSNGSVPPPKCHYEERVDGSSCAQCFDAVTGATIYNSCGSETCIALPSVQLQSLRQGPLLVAGTPAVVDCKECGAAEGRADAVTALAAFSAICAIANVCEDALSSTDSSCATVSMILAPHTCDNPWTPWVQGSDDVAVLQGVLAFALEQRGVALASASVLENASGSVCDACSCETGMRIELLVFEQDRAAVAGLFVGYVVP